jgi:hypothetical protein
MRDTASVTAWRNAGVKTVKVTKQELDSMPNA